MQQSGGPNQSIKVSQIKLTNAPAAAFFEGTPIGVAYYVQRWFRYGLQEWIHKRMRELESKEGVYSRESWR